MGKPWRIKARRGSMEGRRALLVEKFEGEELFRRCFSRVVAGLSAATWLTNGWRLRCRKWASCARKRNRVGINRDSISILGWPLAISTRREIKVWKIRENDRDSFVYEFLPLFRRIYKTNDPFYILTRIVKISTEEIGENFREYSHFIFTRIKKDCSSMGPINSNETHSTHEWKLTLRKSF